MKDKLRTIVEASPITLIEKHRRHLLESGADEPPAKTVEADLERGKGLTWAWAGKTKDTPAAEMQKTSADAVVEQPDEEPIMLPQKRKHWHNELSLDVGPANSFKEVMVEAHNAIRKNAELPALLWSPQLEVYAKRLIGHLAEKGKLDIMAIAESSVKAKALSWSCPEQLEPYAAANQCCQDFNLNATVEEVEQFTCIVSLATKQFGAAVTTNAKGTFVVVAYSVPPVAESPRPSMPAKDPAVLFRETMLAYHNKLRAKVHVGPLVWCPKLQQHAQAYAEILAKRGIQEHSAHETRPDQGENLCKHSTLKMPADQVAFSTCQSFEEESAYYSPGTLMEVYKAPIFGHYTQMVWQETTKLGAAMAAGERGIFVVCRYSPSGNRLGMAAYGSTPAERRARLKGASKAVQSETFKQVMLERHNRARAKVGAPPLQWSTMLELQAEAWVCVMADKGTAMRSPAKSRRKQGETFFVTGIAGLSPEEAAKRCCDQFEDAGERYVAGTPYGNFDMGLSNYTQMVWSTSTIFAAAVVQSPKGTFVVCRYYPAGNEPDKLPYDPSRIMRSPASKHWHLLQHNVLYENKPKSGAEQLRMVFELAMMEQAARQVACEAPDDGRPDPWQKLREKVVGKEQSAGAAQMRNVFEKALVQMATQRRTEQAAPAPRRDNWKKLREDVQKRSRSASPQALLLKQVVEQAVATKRSTQQRPPTPPTAMPMPMPVSCASPSSGDRWKKLREQVQVRSTSPKLKELRSVIDQAVADRARQQRQQPPPAVADEELPQEFPPAQPPQRLKQQQKRSHSASHRDVELRVAFEEVLEEEAWQQEVAAAVPRVSMHDRWSKLRDSVHEQGDLPPGKSRELQVVVEQAIAEHARQQMADRPHTPCAAWARLKDAAEERQLLRKPTAQSRDLQRLLEIGEATLREQRLQEQRLQEQRLQEQQQQLQTQPGQSFKEGLTPLETNFMPTPRSPGRESVGLSSPASGTLQVRPPLDDSRVHLSLRPTAHCRPTVRMPSPHSKPVNGDLLASSPTMSSTPVSSASSRTPMSPSSGGGSLDSPISPSSSNQLSLKLEDDLRMKAVRAKAAPLPTTYFGPAATVGYHSPRLTRGSSSPLQPHPSSSSTRVVVSKHITRDGSGGSTAQPQARLRSEEGPGKNPPRRLTLATSSGRVTSAARTTTTVKALVPRPPSNPPTATWQDEEDEAPSVLISPPTVLNLSSERAAFRPQTQGARVLESPHKTAPASSLRRNSDSSSVLATPLPLRRPPDSYDPRQAPTRRAKSHGLELTVQCNADSDLDAVEGRRQGPGSERLSPSCRLQMASRLLKSDTPATSINHNPTLRRPVSDNCSSAAATPRSTHTVEPVGVDPALPRSRQPGLVRLNPIEAVGQPSPRTLTPRHESPSSSPRSLSQLLPPPEEVAFQPNRRSRSHGLEVSPTTTTTTTTTRTRLRTRTTGR
eukprot:GGOE01042731.1.p1 GENE.GGOE01042731.1~~GGOE01042731.1.p1  ORF type:complete len:1446 (+),score=372.75 GGOE01042731.1:39-4376(+)